MRVTCERISGPRRNQGRVEGHCEQLPDVGSEFYIESDNVMHAYLEIKKIIRQSEDVMRFTCIDGGEFKLWHPSRPLTAEDLGSVPQGESPMREIPSDTLYGISMDRGRNGVSPGQAYEVPMNNNTSSTIPEDDAWAFRGIPVYLHSRDQIRELRTLAVQRRQEYFYSTPLRSSTVLENFNRERDARLERWGMAPARGFTARSISATETMARYAEDINRLASQAQAGWIDEATSVPSQAYQALRERMTVPDAVFHTPCRTVRQADQVTMEPTEVPDDDTF